MTTTKRIKKFKKTNAYKGVFLFLFLRRKYISLAINHGMAVNLQSPDLLKQYQEGKFPKEGWGIEAEKSAIQAANQISRGLWSSFSFILLITSIALCAGYVNGTVHPSFSFNYSLLASFIGTYLASWATLMELGGGFATYSGEALHELIHPAMFKLLFIPGVCFILLGIVV